MLTLTDFHKEVVIHAAGLRRSEEPYRNRYYAYADDVRLLTLVHAGLMTKSSEESEDGLCYFFLTKEGMKKAREWAFRTFKFRYLDDNGVTAMVEVNSTSEHLAWVKVKKLIYNRFHKGLELCQH